MHLLCPHCKNPIELVKLDPSAEVTCTACGSGFRLGENSTAGWTPLGQSVGRFKLVAEVGHGGFGTVYKALDPELDRTVAVKVPRRGNVGEAPHDIDRFLREARSVAQLRHANIVSVHEVGMLDGMPYLVSDFVEGVTLADILTARRPTPHEAAKLIAEVADALQHAHQQGVVHRDMKPSNIMVRPDGSPVVMDFGLAKRDAGEITMTVDGQVLGTPAYMSPEQARGEGHGVDGRSDIYSLGVILYQLLTGELPFRGNTRMLLHQVLHDDPKPPRTLNDRLPRDLETICLKSMAKEPARRYATAGELVADLRRFLGGEAILARPLGSIERGWRWCKRNRRVAALLGTVFSLLTLVAVGSVAAAIVFNEQKQVIAGQRDENARQRDEIADREKEVAQQKGIAEGRLKVYQKSVDRFVNEAPAIIEGHPLGSTPLRDLLELSATLLREVQGTVDDHGLAVRGEMSALIRQGHLAKSQGRPDDAAKAYDKAFEMATELLRTSTPEELGKNSGNLALIIIQRASMVRIRGETQVGYAENAKARETFAAAVKLHRESISLFQRVVDEPQMRDIHIGEAQTWLAGAYFELAETFRASVVAEENPAGVRAAHESARIAAKQAEEHFAAGLAAGGHHRAIERTRLRQALASYERARAADALELNAEADVAFQRSFDLFNQLVKDTPKNFLHRIEFAKLAADQGHFLMMKMRDGKRADTAFNVAVEQNRRVAHPVELNQYHNSMAINLYRQGIAMQQNGDSIRARELFRRCVVAHEEQLREAIRISSERSLYTVYPRIRLMFAQVRAGDHASAAAYAAELRADYDKNGERLSLAAQGFALAAAATDDGEQEVIYVDRAFESLTRAVDMGHADVNQMERDPDYDHLRADERFSPLLERAKANARKKP